jgi:hypothetical protein
LKTGEPTGTHPLPALSIPHSQVNVNKVPSG